MKDRDNGTSFCSNCGGVGQHYVPPCLGKEGFFICKEMNEIVTVKSTDGLCDNTDYTEVEKSPGVKLVELQADLDRTRKELEEARPYMDAIRQRHNGYNSEMQKIGIKEPKSPKAALDSLIGEAEAVGLAESKEYRKELDRWKTMAQRHNPSGCCCQIDENNGDPLMVEPCAFHAEWRDTVLEALREKVRTQNPSQPTDPADNGERPDPGMNMYYKNRTIANTEKVSTESVTQPKIDFCYACGTALGVE